LATPRNEKLPDNIAAATVMPTPEELATLDASSRLPAEYPGRMLEFMNSLRPRPTGAPRHRVGG
jgi:hypothetical protein